MQPRPKSLTLQLIALALSFASEPLHAQSSQQLPAVRVQAKYDDPDRSWPDSARQAIRDSLARGRERWERVRPREYVVSVLSTLSMFVLERDPKYDGQLEATRVVGDSIVAIVSKPAASYTRRTLWRHTTVDRVFRLLEAEVADPSRQVKSLTLDSTMGYPRSWHTDDARNGFGRAYVSDQFNAGSVVHFEPYNEPLCAWWRRLVRRCHTEWQIVR